MKNILCYVLILIILPIKIYALSELEWQNLVKTSSLFKFAEDKLALEWKKQYMALPDSPQKQAILISQQNWIKNGRDVVAQQYIKQGMSYANAYAKATLDRIENLKNEITEIQKNSRSSGSNDETLPSVSKISPQTSAPNLQTQRTFHTAYPIEQSTQQGTSGKFGPKICGFQLGMNINEAILNAKRLNIPMQLVNYSSYCYYYTDHLVAWFEYDGTKSLTSFTLSEDLFNAKGSSLEQFVKMFSDLLKINFSHIEHYGHPGFQAFQSNNNKKYKISVGTQFTSYEMGKAVKEVEVTVVQK